ncbi:MAG TPA: hypothetical protein VEI45_20585 [Mycobacterium sp.]|nr:hypothetical protein [Mycobacterium sp.]
MAVIQQRISHLYRRQRPTPLPGRLASSAAAFIGGSGVTASTGFPSPLIRRF